MGFGGLIGGIVGAVRGAKAAEEQYKRQAAMFQEEAWNEVAVRMREQQTLERKVAQVKGSATAVYAGSNVDPTLGGAFLQAAIDQTGDLNRYEIQRRSDRRIRRFLNQIQMAELNMKAQKEQAITAGVGAALDGLAGVVSFMAGSFSGGGGGDNSGSSGGGVSHAPINTGSAGWT